MDHRNSSLTILEAGESEAKGPAWSGSGGARFFIQPAPSHCVLSGSKGPGSSGNHFDKSTNPIQGGFTLMT